MPDSYAARLRSTSPTSDSQTSLTPDIIDRCARLIANDEIGWPGDISDEEAHELGKRVRRYRRQNLIRLISRVIAADISAPSPG